MKPKHNSSLGLHLTVLICIALPAISQHLVHIPDGETENDAVDDQPIIAQVKGSEIEKFIATREWQTIREGQSIPKGLHVRVNLQTGLKEAKLLDDYSEEGKLEEASSETGSHGDKKVTITLPDDHQEGHVGGSNGMRMSAVLEEALKNIATSHDEPSGNKEPQANTEHTKQVFRSMEEIKQAFSKKNITLSSEMEILSSLLEELQQSPSSLVESTDSILEDIEFYLHNFDNAIYFTDIGGIDILINLVNTSTVLKVVAKSALTLGVACQSNSYVVSAARRSIPVLLRHLQTAVISDAYRSSNQLTEHLLFAVSSMVRTNHSFLSDLLTHGAGGIFRNIVGESRRITMKSKVKVYTLITDLLQSDDGAEAVLDLLYQNQFVSQLCDSLSSLLMQADKIDHREKLVMFAQLSWKQAVCKDFSTELIDALNSVQQIYSEEINDPDIGDYYKEFVQKVASVKDDIIKKKTGAAADRTLDEL